MELSVPPLLFLVLSHLIGARFTTRRSVYGAAVSCGAPRNIVYRCHYPRNARTQLIQGSCRNERPRVASLTATTMGALSRPSWSSYFPPLTFRSFLSHYLPASGAASHTLFAVHIFNPTFVSRLVFLPYLLLDLALQETNRNL